MSTPVNPQQPFMSGGDGPGDEKETVEVTFIAPPITDSNDAHELVAIDAPVSTGSGISAPMPGVGSFSFATVGGRLRDMWRMLLLNPKVMIGLSVVVFFVVVAIVGPLVLHVDPNALSPDSLQPPSATHWLGTTQTGQDIFAQLIYGSQTTIFWGFVTGLVVTLLSISVGLSSGYFGGVVDEALSLLTNIFLVLPALPLAIVLAAFIPYKGPLTVALVIMLTSWAWGARVLRSQTLSLRKRDFIEAAKAGGETNFRVIFYELLPNEIAIATANFIGTTIYVVLAQVTLDFIGLGNALDTKVHSVNLQLEFLFDLFVGTLLAAVADFQSHRGIARFVRRQINNGRVATVRFRYASVVRKGAPIRAPAIDQFIHEQRFVLVGTTVLGSARELERVGVIAASA